MSNDIILENALNNVENIISSRKIRLKKYIEYLKDLHAEYNDNYNINVVVRRLIKLEPLNKFNSHLKDNLTIGKDDIFENINNKLKIDQRIYDQMNNMQKLFFNFFVLNNINMTISMIMSEIGKLENLNIILETENHNIVILLKEKKIYPEFNLLFGDNTNDKLVNKLVDKKIILTKLDDLKKITPIEDINLKNLICDIENDYNDCMIEDFIVSKKLKSDYTLSINLTNDNNNDNINLKFNVYFSKYSKFEDVLQKINRMITINGFKPVNKFFYNNIKINDEKTFNELKKKIDDVNKLDVISTNKEGFSDWLFGKEIYFEEPKLNPKVKNNTIINIYSNSSKKKLMVLNIDNMDIFDFTNFVSIIENTLNIKIFSFVLYINNKEITINYLNFDKFIKLIRNNPEKNEINIYVNENKFENINDDNEDMFYFKIMNDFLNVKNTIDKSNVRFVKYFENEMLNKMPKEKNEKSIVMINKNKMNADDQNKFDTAIFLLNDMVKNEERNINKNNKNKMHFKKNIKTTAEKLKELALKAKDRNNYTNSDMLRDLALKAKKN